MLLPLQIPNARTSRRALYARTSLDDANGVQSLAPTKDTVVTGFAELPIGKESVSSRLFVHQPHFQSQRWSALSLENAEPLVAKMMSSAAPR